MPTIAEQKRYYDEFWEKQIPLNYLQMARAGAILTELSGLELIQPRVLDLGCGNGWLTAMLAAFGEAIGADLSIETAAQRFPNIHFVNADFNRWKPELAPFDVIVCQEVFEHIEERHAFLASIKSLLKPDGRLILTTPNAKIVRAWKAERSTQPNENIYTAKELRHLLGNSFVIDRFRTILVGPGKLRGHGNQFSGFHRLLNSAKLRSALRRLGALRTYDRALERAGLGLHFVVVARRR